MGNSRLVLITSVFALLYAAAAFNFYNLQIRKGNYYSIRAESQHFLAGDLDPERGDIFFSDEDSAAVPAAIKNYQPVIYAAPKSIADYLETANLLAPILGQSEEELAVRLNQPDAAYLILEKKPSEEQIGKIEELGLDGIYVDEEAIRFYPNGSLASQVLGFITDKIGRYGVEAFYDERLAGTPGRLEDEKIVPPQNGTDINLTIDRNIQAAAEQILAKLMADYPAERGMIAAMESRTGAILAMASSPDFDPNHYGEYPLKNFMNPFVQEIYEPGSVFKLITMAAGIDSEKISPETEYTDTGRTVLNGQTIMNWDKKAHGRINMTTVLEQSLNTGSVFAERTMGNAIFGDYLTRFGFEQRTGIDLPGEVIGNARLVKQGKDIDFATASFGQGIAVSPIQLMAAVNAIANQGIMVRPRLLIGRIEEISRPISAETSRKVAEMMVSVVERGQMVKINGYSVAGKTGTAQVPDLERGGYTDKVINSYIGFAPAFDPKFIIIVRLDKPVGSPLAGVSVAPAFRELCQYMLNYYKVPPDRVIGSD
jgi:cell division protein FtsI/penicillin-binding protein 2